ncbi:alpha/beta hydrolase [Pseudonocardia ailaonensis]|uniref:Alpha/beta hydrolase n=1 Tax=Pseudonocardia ailaonensis TaxID=367279 RepID=A0ABN2NA48_9PSEU
MTPTRPARRLPVALLGAVLGLAVVGTACSTPTASSATIAENVDIGGGRTVYVECHGEARNGAPTVLLMSGSGTASDLWHAPEQEGPNVYDTIGAQTRTCTLDRPGVQYLDGAPSRSTPVAQPTGPQDGARDWDSVIDALGMEGPYVIAAHSFAGNIARVFAAEHPDEVKGIVFVDVLSPELRASMTPAEWAVWVPANNRTPEQLAAYPDLERQDFDVSLDEVVATEAKVPPSPKPVVVLQASVKFDQLVPQYLDEGFLPAWVPRDFGQVIDRTNATAQTKLASEYPGSKHITDTNAGHNIMIDSGPIVIKAIEDVLAAVEAGRTTAS